MRALTIAAMCSVGCAFIILAPALIFAFGDWHRIGFLGFFGLFMGLMSAPEFEPKAFKSPGVFQFVSGGLAGAAGGAAISFSLDVIVLGALIGAVLGLFAPSWIRHMVIP